MPTAHDIVVIPKEYDEDLADYIGRVAVSRTVLAAQNIPVPSAFVITADLFYRFLSHQNGLNKWRQIMSAIDVHNPESIIDGSRALQKLVLNQPYLPEIVSEITVAYAQVINRHWAHLTISPAPFTKAPVHVPLPIIKGETSLMDFLRRLWSMQLSPHALSLHLSQEPHQLLMPSPVLVSQFEPAIKSGSIFSVDPVTGNKNLIRLEAIWGTNPQEDPQPIHTDIYLIDKSTKTVISRIIGRQDNQIVSDRFGLYRKKPVPADWQSQPKLSPDEYQKLVGWVLKLQASQFKPVKLNWLQSDKQLWGTRYEEIALPVKTHYAVQVKPAIPKKHTLLAEGLVAAPGMTTAPITRLKSSTTTVTGQIVILKSAESIQLTKARSAAGIIVETGALTTELAMTAREIGIPTLVGTGPIKLAEGNIVTLDAIHGQVIQCKAVPTPQTELITAPSNVDSSPVVSPPKMVTKILLNLTRLDPTQSAVYLKADGIGLCRGSDLLLLSNTHPAYVITHQATALKTEVVNQLNQLTQQFGDRPVWYYPFDLHTGEAGRLTHAKEFESSGDQNPLIGYRGAYRMIHDSIIFPFELRCLLELKHKYRANNLNLMIPFVRSAFEYQQVKKILAGMGMYRSASCKIGVELATSAAPTFMESLADLGVDSFMVNCDLLAALIEGYDPNSAEVDQQLVINHPAVINQLQHMCQLAGKLHIPVIAVGYQLDQHADALEAVISAGVTGVSISSHRYDSVSAHIQLIENRRLHRSTSS